MCQVNTEGDLLKTVAISLSGEAIAFGGSGGYIHVWSMHDTPRVNLSSSALSMPLRDAPAAVPLREDDFFAAAATYSSQGVRSMVQQTAEQLLSCQHPACCWGSSSNESQASGLPTIHI